MNCPPIALALSIAVLSPTAKAQGSGSNSDTSQRESAQSVQFNFAHLIQSLMNSGGDHTIINGFAQVIGLPHQMTSKSTSAWISHHGKDKDIRACQVAYESDENGGKRPVCVYMERTKSSKHDSSSQYFRVTLDGQLEKVVSLRNKLDDDGKPLQEGRAKFDEDIDSPEIRKAFKVELTYWLKDWLKKQESTAAPAAQ